MSTKIVTLTTDFGIKDQYVAEIKATILGICPKVILVDITHEIAKFNIRMGAYVLASAAPYFPDGTVHVAVVDPSVGTRRRPIVIQTKQSYFIGPDNGVLVLAATKQGIKSIHELANPRLMLPELSSTFHGRDIFAPAAAHLLNGVKASEFGPEVREVMEADFEKVTKKNGVLFGEVLHVDGFGNIITNINQRDITQNYAKDEVKLELAGNKLKLKFCKTYGETQPQEPLTLIGSHGFLEISVNQGNAAEKFETKAGDKIKLLLHGRS